MELVVIVVILLIIAAAVLAATKGKGAVKGSPPRARMPLTKNEQPMYFRIAETFPEYVVLAQVAFSALVTSSNQGTRNRFNRKVADFVLCSKAFEVIAIIELDDSSHKNKEESDAQRDELLTGAGYRVIRFQRVPDMNSLRASLGIKP